VREHEELGISARDAGEASGYAPVDALWAARVAAQEGYSIELVAALLGEAARIARAREGPGGGGSSRSALAIAAALRELCSASVKIMGPDDPLRRVVNQDPGALRRH